MVAAAYDSKPPAGMEAYHQLWLAVGLAPQKAAHIMGQMAIVLNDSEYVKQVHSVYSAMIQAFETND